MKGHHFDSVEDIQKKLQEVLDSLKEKDFLTSRHGKNAGFLKLIHTEPTLKEMGALSGLGK